LPGLKWIEFSFAFTLQLIQFISLYLFINTTINRGTGDTYFEAVLTGVCPSMLGLSTGFNKMYLKKMPTVVLEGVHNVGKTQRAMNNLSLGSSTEVFFSGSVNYIHALDS